MCQKEICKIKNKKWLKTLDYRIKKGEEVFEKLDVDKLDYFRSAFEILRKELVSDEEIRQVLKNGWVIDARPDMILILGYVKINKRYLPVHVKLKRTQHNVGVVDWHISQAYYPTEEVWGEEYKERKCFCIKTEDRKAMIG